MLGCVLLQIVGLVNHLGIESIELRCNEANPTTQSFACELALQSPSKNMNDHVVKTSKYLSMLLRHQPDKIGLVLDDNGWANVEELIAKANATGKSLSRSLIERVVAENDKKRFALSDDGMRIRASQGHSVEVDLALPPQTPPETLFHGTATRFVESIREKGLIPGNRQHVHLSLLRETAEAVGRRHGKLAVLIVQSGEMHRAGHAFYLSDNGVWLTDSVPTSFIVFEDVS